MTGLPRYERADELPAVQDPDSGLHEWINLRGTVSCRKCGVVRPYDWDKRDLKCRGVVRITLR